MSKEKLSTSHFFNNNPPIERYYRQCISSLCLRLRNLMQVYDLVMKLSNPLREEGNCTTKMTELRQKVHWWPTHRWKCCRLCVVSILPPNVKHQLHSTGNYSTLWYFQHFQSVMFHSWNHFCQSWKNSSYWRYDRHLPQDEMGVDAVSHICHLNRLQLSCLFFSLTHDTLSNIIGGMRINKNLRHIISTNRTVNNVAVLKATIDDFPSLCNFAWRYSTRRNRDSINDVVYSRTRVARTGPAPHVHIIIITIFTSWWPIYCATSLSGSSSSVSLSIKISLSIAIIGRRYWGAGILNASEIHVWRFSTRDVTMQKNRELFIFSITDGTVKFPGRDQLVWRSFSIQDLPPRREEHSDDLEGESNGSHPSSRLTNDNEVRNCFFDDRKESHPSSLHCITSWNPSTE